ncbi:otoancorin-like [Protopterus annectens]|uniref:otoancorin-like n=1 Tax=Protopterus annectens TaxID=7888 RepID=UPI001CF9758E|nr:otoancorin-like [Protopterus annectens]XP_043942466.1 otoancorin-like [Protopterus annectens]
MPQTWVTHYTVVILVCLSLLGSTAGQKNENTGNKAGDSSSGNKGDGTSKGPCSQWETVLKNQLSNPFSNYSAIIAGIAKNVPSLSTQCVNTFSVTSNLSAVAELMKLLNNNYDSLDSGTKQAVYKWQEAMGKAKPRNDTKSESSWISFDILKMMGRFILQASVSTLQDLVKNSSNPVCQLYNSSSDIWNQLIDLTPAQASCFLSGLQTCNVTLTDPATIQRLGQLNCFYDSFIDKLSPLARTALQTQLKNCTRNVNNLYQKLLKDISIVNMTGDNLKNLGSAATGLSVKQLANLSADALSGALESLGKIKGWSESQKKALAKKAVDVTNVPGNVLRQLGSLASGVSTKVLQNMTGNDVLDAFQNKDMKDSLQDMTKAQKKAILNTVMKNTSTDDILKKLPDELVQDVPASKLKEANNETLKQLLNKPINWTLGQAIALWNKLSKNELNNPAFISTLNTSAKGLTCEIIQSMQPQSLSALATNPCITRDQIRCAATRFFSYGAGVYFSNITQDYLNTVPPTFLLYIKSFSDVEKIPKSLCYSVVMLLGQTDIKLLPRNSGRRNELQKYTMNCLNNTDTSTLTPEQANDLGSLVCTFNNTNIKNLNSAAFLVIIDQLQQCGRFEEPIKTELRNKIIQTFNSTSTWTVDTLNQLGSLLAVMTQDDFKTLPNTEVVKTALQAITATLPTTPGKFVVPEFDNRPDLTYLYSKIADILRSSRTQKSNRRKRADCSTVSAPTTDDIRSMGQYNSRWTASELSCMSTSTFSDTMDILATVPGFNSEQLQALKSKALETFEQSITLDKLSSLKRINFGFTADEIKKYSQGIDVDTLASISQYPEWSTKQYATQSQNIVQNFLANNPVNQLTSIDLVAVAYFLCSFSTDQIKGISTTAYRSAARDIGALRCSDSNVLTSLKTKAVEVFGSPSNWTGDILQEIGTVVAGLDSSEIQQLNIEAVKYITPDAVALIPPSTFSAMSIQQLQKFGTDNYGAVTTEQLNSLSSTKQFALRENSGSSSQNSVSSGAAQWRLAMIPAIIFINLLFCSIFI